MKRTQLLLCGALAMTTGLTCSEEEESNKPEEICMTTEHVYKRLQPFFLQSEYNLAFEALGHAQQNCPTIMQQVNFRVDNSLQEGGIFLNEMGGITIQFPCSELDLNFIADMQKVESLIPLNAYDRFQVSIGEVCL